MTKILKPNIVRGGVAIPLGRNYYYMAGRKHKNGGIDIGKDLEVEGGEVVKTNPKEIKVYSAQPFLSGISPAERILRGENPARVFNAQESYKDRNRIKDDGSKAKMGGLSRSKDYGSKSKPYPNVAKKDFAGGNRSYPIPTKADAIDALRLAGLHGRNDVKAKVYRKYPELKKKANGGVYVLNNGKESSLRMIPSTGERSKSKTAKITRIAKMQKGGNKKDNEYVIELPEIEVTPQDNYSIKSINAINPITDNINKIKNLRPRDITTDLNDITTRNIQNKVNQQIIDSITAPTLRQSISQYFRSPAMVSDAIGFGSNLISGIIGATINKRMLDNMQAPTAPIMEIAPKLKTRININPQLSRMRENLASYERDVDDNTASSQVALARKQRGRLDTLQGYNELYGNRENAETELINQDKLNRQEVAARNIERYNNWRNAVTDFNNNLENLRSENRIGLISNINQGLQNTLSNIQQRANERRTISAMMSANKNLPIEELLMLGLITPEQARMYRISNPLKTNI